MKVLMSSVAIAAIALTAPSEALTHKVRAPTSTPSSIRDSVVSSSPVTTTTTSRVVSVPAASTSIASTARVQSFARTTPTCVWATLVDEDGIPQVGNVGISCPVYDPFYRSHFYGKPVTVEQHQQNLVAYRQQQLDQVRTSQQQYNDYIQSRIRYQQEIAQMSQQRYAQYIEQQQEFQQEQVAYQQELLAKQMELQQQRITEQQKMWEEYKESGFFPAYSAKPANNYFNSYWSPFGSFGAPAPVSDDSA